MIDKGLELDVQQSDDIINGGAPSHRGALEDLNTPRPFCNMNQSNHAGRD